MTKPVQAFELSAMIDGELDEARAVQLRDAIRQDPILRAEFERIEAAHHAWDAAAATACFHPAVHLPRLSTPSTALMSIVALLSFLLAAARLISKLLPIELITAVAVHALMLAATLTMLIWIVGRIESEPSWPGSSKMDRTAING